MKNRYFFISNIYNVKTPLKIHTKVWQADEGLSTEGFSSYTGFKYGVKTSG